MRLVDQVNNPRFWPTPRAGKTSSENPEVWAKRQREGKVSTPPLGMAAQMWPTPQASDFKHPGLPRRGTGSASAHSLAAKVTWPTLTTQDAKNNGGASQMERNTKPLNAEVGGSLNPTWCEWLMGYRSGWTDLNAWVIPWFRPKREKRLKG